MVIVSSRPDVCWASFNLKSCLDFKLSWSSSAALQQVLPSCPGVQIFKWEPETKRGNQLIKSLNYKHRTHKVWNHDFSRTTQEIKHRWKTGNVLLFRIYLLLFIYFNLVYQVKLLILNLLTIFRGIDIETKKFGLLGRGPFILKISQAV